ncbi:hypothetical protein EVAR_46533_1 [Eumeta japonica]|uniref:DNA/RNA non-specific endonuclease/pyrophosphatase/phosphodiesterase domain-containing protein n=1 Tax=Eumeta variegata TaxID=151549 RepID=A0A4C1XL30_EUMVA|nr:hypothetical protein EVAR_46533_1 [Eumeta japonica]
MSQSRCRSRLRFHFDALDFGSSPALDLDHPFVHAPILLSNHRAICPSEGSLFGKIRMNSVYTLKKQKERFLQILGPGADEKYLTKADSLTRGHLAARADFGLEFSQRASFHLVNVAPQWRRGNQGDWAALESALRQRVHKRGRRVTVYTGAYGVTALRDARGAPRPVYLASDDNGNEVVSVPMYFYKASVLWLGLLAF